MPFLGDVEVRGKAPAQLSTELAARFKEYVNSPFVTVTLEEPHPTTVSVLGEVSHPGVYTVEGAAGVLQALAAAGGLTEYAGHDSIFVVRRSSASRIRFSIASLSEGTSRSAGFRLQAGDAVMVE
jgi:polysaccharide export outer membrane protein